MKNPVFKRALQAAWKYIRQPRRLRRLAEQVRWSLTEDGRQHHKSRLKAISNQLLLMLEMLQVWLRGEYPGMSRQTIVKVVAALLYFVWVVDLIPDVFLWIGFLDDAAVIAWVFEDLKEEIQEYRQWKQRHQP